MKAIDFEKVCRGQLGNVGNNFDWGDNFGVSSECYKTKISGKFLKHDSNYNTMIPPTQVVRHLARANNWSGFHV